MDTGQNLIARLNIQQDQYLALKDAVTRQATHIRAMDVAGLTTDMAETRSLMRKVRDLEADLRPLRQSWHSLGLDREPSERRVVDELVDNIRETVEEIQAIKAENETLLKSRMGDLRKEMSGLQTQGKAALAYQGPKSTERAAPPAKFIDRVTE
ncbi:TPA: hypothetical protein DCE37_09245 [Candidatus Latescibacteria bacterium]|nr:hypothetical protein [Gemmatimonadota bacterium]HAA75291.1 hypothetical protein [Candidatus Latescibacterota bacterium]